MAEDGAAPTLHTGTTAVVLAYGGAAECKPLVESLVQAPPGIVDRVIVVHNPSFQGEEIAPMDLPDEVAIVNNPSNRGYAAGMNAGIAEANRVHSDTILLLTHEVRITAAAIQTMVARMRQEPSYGVVGPMLVSPTVGVYSAGVVQVGRVRLEHRTAHYAPTQHAVWPCDRLDGSVMLWRSTALERVGPFDERFFMYFEDFEITGRAASLGYGVGVCVGASATSEPGGAKRKRAHAYLRARNGLEYARAYGMPSLLAGMAQLARAVWWETPARTWTRDRAARVAALQYWRGTFEGILAFVTRTWGPPPAGVLNKTDIGAVDKPE